MKKTIAILLTAALWVMPVVAQSGESITTDEDDLFGSEDDLFGDPLVTGIDDSGGATVPSLLVSETVRIGGRYSFSVRTGATWDDPKSLVTDPLDPDSVSLSTELSSRLFFDARPNENFRVFGKMTASYPFRTLIHVEELFSDFNWNDTVFFRGGKQTMTWGVGYFYSPADLLSIAQIDPEDPDAELEGPVALRANIPLGVNNLYLYALPATGDEPFDIGLAAKGELVVGRGEIGAGVIYQRDIAPAGMLTVSTSAGAFDLFAEGVLKYGSNRTFIVESAMPPFFATERRSDEFFVNATAGFRWSDSLGDTSSTVGLIAQYLYNGEGYDDGSIIWDNVFTLFGLREAGWIEFADADLQSTGKHYVAASASWSDVLGSEVDATVFWMQNFSDMSARVTPSLSRTIVDDVTLRLQMPMALGREGGELTPFGESLSLGLSLALGGGSF